MYLILLVFISLCIILLCFFYFRRNDCKTKISGMSYEEKCSLLNKLSKPFGFSYEPNQDIFTSRTDAWQRTYGYGNFYDVAALSSNMAFDCEPVYFNYQGKTWLIEFWKGQYGISTGAEIGIYHADSIIPPALRRQTIFEAALPEEMLPIKIGLSSDSFPFFNITCPHWWQAGFVVGNCNLPEDLTLEITLTFPNEEMCSAFVRSLTTMKYKNSEFHVYNTTVQVDFTNPKSTASIPWDSWVQSYVLWKSRIFCKLYLWVTQSFSDSKDRLLYLYYFLPFIFRRIMNIRPFSKYKKQRF